MTAASNQFIISVMSRDRVGIIYDMSRAISSMHGDITDMRQQVLQGYFSMILYAAFPAQVSEEEIKRELLSIGEKDTHLFEISVKPIGEPFLAEESDLPDYTYVLTARGHDKIGFVASVAGFCVENNINILDLSTTVSDGNYIMILLVDLRRCPAIEKISTELDTFNAAHNLQLVLQHYDIFRATHEVKML